MTSDSTQAETVRTLTLAVEGATDDQTWMKATEAIGAVPFVVAAAVDGQTGVATVRVPAGFTAFETVEKALADAGLTGRYLDPIHVRLKVTRADGTVDLPALSNTLFTASGVITAAPNNRPNELAVYAEPAGVDLKQIVELAGGQGCQVEVLTHETLEFQVQGMDCASCAPEVEKVLRSVPGVAAARAWYNPAKAIVLADKGRLDPAKLTAALEAEGFTAEGCKRKTEKKDDCSSCQD